MSPPIRLLLLFGLLLIPGRCPHAEESLGRLFFTPQQRDAMDRRQGVSLAGKTGATQGSTTIDGEIWRNASRRARWINGKTDTGAEAQAPATPVGDTFQYTTGERESLLGTGQLRIHPGKREQ